MKLFTIFGDPVSHSRSPLMHNYVFNQLNIPACYTRTHLIDGNKLKEVFESKCFDGANVTVPHKEAAFEACDEIRGIANSIGVVNTLVREGDRLIGYNTDADGFMSAIQSFGTIHHALILGAGGTARALSVALDDQGIVPTILNRSSGRLIPFQDKGFKTFTWENFEASSYDLIINTTSAGLSDDEYPLPLSLLEPLLQTAKAATDVIYGKKTPFLKKVDSYSLPYKDGSDMLLEQGVIANHLFLGKTVPLDVIRPIMKKTFSF